MPRRLRLASGGNAYHVLNRAVARERIFKKARDFEAFEEVIEQAKARLPMRVLAWCAMPTHWHFVLWPRGDGDLSEFMRWLTVTHTQRWHAAHLTSGTGALIRGDSSRSRFKRTIICLRCCVMWNGTHCGQIWCRRRLPGGGRVFGIACMAATPGLSTTVRCQCPWTGCTMCRSAKRRRVRGVATIGGAQARRLARHLAGTNGQATRPGVHATRSGSSTESSVRKGIAAAQKTPDPFESPPPKGG